MKQTSCFKWIKLLTQIRPSTKKIIRSNEKGDGIQNWKALSNKCRAANSTGRSETFAMGNGKIGSEDLVY